MIGLNHRTVPAMLHRGTEQWPDKDALVCGEDRLTYSELNECSRRVGAGLDRLGVEPGDTVALMLENSIEHVLAWFGASNRNAVEVPLNTASAPPQIEYILTHCQAEILIIDARYIDRLRPAVPQLSKLRTLVVCGDLTAAEDLPFEVHAFATLMGHGAMDPVPVGPGDPLGILYTSGTTGEPKGVVVSHAQTYGRMWPGGPGTPTHDDRTLIVLPIYHVIGQCRGLYNTLIVGGTAVLAQKFSASRFWDICRANDITFVPLVGVMATYLLAQPTSDTDREHPVRHVALGTTSPEVELFRERFGIAEVSMSYGLTEAGGVLVGAAESSGCGYLRPDFEARLVDEAEVEVAPGEVGELVLRSRDPWGTMVGYYRQPQETVDRWRNLWLHTGDLMWRRDDGMFVFAGRRAERIRVRGENVSPGEVEQQILGFPGITDCAVVGIDAHRDEAGVGEQEILAAIVTDGVKPDLEVLATYLESRLPPFAVPRFFSTHETLPRTDATQRVQRAELATQDPRTLWDRRVSSRLSGTSHQRADLDMNGVVK